MIINMTRKKSGVVEYLKRGHNKEYEGMERDDRDYVVSLTGDLDEVDKIIKYINKKKKWKDSYLHITISFTEKDFEQFYDPQTDSYDLDKMNELIEELISLLMSGYEKEEYTYYGELHFPKLKINPKTKKPRLKHFHIIIPLLNLLDETKLKPLLFSVKRNDLIQTYLAKKFNMELPIDYAKSDNEEKEIKAFAGTKRKELLQAIKQNRITTQKELEEFFKKSGIKFKRVEKKGRAWYEVKLKNKKVMLRGKGAEFVEEIATFGEIKNFKKYDKKLWQKVAEQHKQKTLKELEDEISELIEKRKEFIENRRSKRTKKLIEELKKEKEQAELPTPQNYISQPQEVKRPTNTTEQVNKERQEEKKLDKELIKEIKTNLDPQRVLKYAKEHYKLDTSIYEVIGNKINNKTNKQKPKNPIDFLQKEVGLSIKEAFSVADKLYQEQLRVKQVLHTDNRMQQEQERTGMILSYNTYTKKDYPVDYWKTRKLKNKTELETLIKNYPYSPFVFKNGYRKGENTQELTALILDFDNDNKDYIISMEQVLNKLKQAGIKALAVETKSSGKEKGGIVAERFRVIIPIENHIPINKENREEYARAVELFTKELGLYDYLDKGALRDIARMYRPSPLGAKATAINGKAVDFNEYMEQAKKVILREKEEQERQRQERLKRLQSIEDNISSYTYETGTEENLAGLTYADTSKILSIPFENLINHFETIEKEEKEGSYKYLITPNAKYSILKNGEVMHDFKSGKTYNKISYLYEKLGVNNLMSLARELEKITGESYIKINENLVKNAIKKATEQATDLYEFNDIIKRECNVEFCRVDLKNNTIQIADITFNTDTKAILDKINENKAEKEAQQQAYKPKRSFGM